MTTPDSTPIADRVRFWEEQDEINQELIPRVIRQHELLTAHIADHENLPLITGNAISEVLAEAREEQQRHYDAALEAVRQKQQQQYDEWRQTRNILIGITAVSGTIAVAAIIVGSLI